MVEKKDPDHYTENVAKVGRFRSPRREPAASVEKFIESLCQTKVEQCGRFSKSLIARETSVARRG